MAEWPPIGKIAAHSAYEMFSWYKYLIVGLAFSRLGFWSGSLFLIAPFPDLCLLVLFCINHDPGMTMTFLRQGQPRPPMHLNGKKEMSFNGRNKSSEDLC